MSGSQISFSGLSGSHRAPARAMLKAVGFTDDDLRKPLVGVANTWIEIGPCNLHLRRLAAAVKEGIRAAGGTPMEFNTVSISDGITMGTEGMRISLVSREVIADSIELVARGQHVRRARRSSSAATRPSPARPWRWPGSTSRASSSTAARSRPAAGRARTSPSRTSSRPSARSTAGKLDASRVRGARERGLPGRRRLRRPVHRQHHGHGVRVPRPLADGQRDVPAIERRQGRGRRAQAGALVVDLLKRGLRPRADPHPRRARERHRLGRRHRRLDQRRAAPAGDRQGGGRPARPRGLRPHQRVGAAPGRPQARRPVRRHRPLRRRRHAARRRSACSSAGRLHAGAITVTGRTHRRGSRQGRRNAGPGSRPPARLAAQGRRAAWPSSAATSRPTAAWSRSPGTTPRHHRGPARVFDSEEAGRSRRVAARTDPGRRRRRHPLRRTEGRPGHARDARRHGRDRGRRAGRFGGAAHRRPLLGRDARPDGRPRGAGSGAGGPIAAVREGDIITFDVERREAATSTCRTTELRGAAGDVDSRRRRATRRA